MFDQVGATACLFGMGTIEQVRDNFNGVDYLRAARRVQQDFDPSYLFVGLFIGNDVLRYDRSSYAQGGLREALRSSLFSYSWLRMGLGRLVSSPAPSEQADRARAPIGPGAFYDDFTGSACSEAELRQHIALRVIGRAFSGLRCD